MSCEPARSEPLRPSLEAAASRALWLVLCSALLATVTLSVALWLTRPSDEAASSGERSAGSTPERAAESFIEAYRSGAFERAAHFATGQLAQTLIGRAEGPAQRAMEHESFVVQESHRLEQHGLRLSGVLVREGQAEAEGKAVSLTLQRQDGRYLVEEITW
jgi:hypothetical protein